MGERCLESILIVFGKHDFIFNGLYTFSFHSQIYSNGAHKFYSFCLHTHTKQSVYICYVPIQYFSFYHANITIIRRSERGASATSEREKKIYRNDNINNEEHIDFVPQMMPAKIVTS